MRILLVEDEVMIANKVMEQLYEIGYTDVVHARDSVEGTNLFLKKRPDLVIMDVGLKSSALDGIELAKTLVAKVDVPLVFLSGYSDKRTIDRIKEIKDARYLIKPCSLRQLFVTIDLALSTFYKGTSENIAYPPTKCPLYGGQTVFVKHHGQVYQRLEVEEILYLQSVRGGVEIYNSSNRYILSTSLASVMEQLPTSELIRVHRSYAVNSRKVLAIAERELHLEYQGKTIVVPVSESYWKTVKGSFVRLTAS